MSTSINRLHSTYNFRGRRSASHAGVARRLDGLARTSVKAAFGNAVDPALAGDDRVFIFRNVKSHLRLPSIQSLTDQQLSQLWGEHLAKALVHAIANGISNSTNAVVFDDQAAYVASFVSDVIDGTATDCWYYSQFAAVLHLPPEQTIVEVLRSNQQHLPQILAKLHVDGRVADLARSLSPDQLDAIWQADLLGEDTATTESLRPLVVTALELAQVLGFIRPQDFADISSLTRECQRHLEDTIDWHDPESLAGAVINIVRRLVQQADFEPNRSESADLDAAEPLIRKHVTSLNLDWLDSHVLLNGLVTVWYQRNKGQGKAQAYATKMRLTPRQISLYSNLASTLGRVPIKLGSDNFEATTAIKIYAALVADFPQWASDSLATTLVERFLQSVSCLTRQHSQTIAAWWAQQASGRKDANNSDPPSVRLAASFLSAVFQAVPEMLPALSGKNQSLVSPSKLPDSFTGDRKALPSPPSKSSNEFTDEREVPHSKTPDKPADTRDASRSSSTSPQMPTASANVLPRVQQDSETSPSHAYQSGFHFPTKAAGIFLLARAFLDAKFASWAEVAIPNDEHRAALFAAVAERTAGLSSSEDVDLGIAEFVGPGCPTTASQLLENLPASLQVAMQLQSKLLEVNAGQRVLRAHRLYLHAFDFPASQIACLVDETSHNIAFARTIESNNSIELAGDVNRWLAKLHELTGLRSELTIDGALQSRLPRSLIASFVNENAVADVPVIAAHLKSRSRLEATWQSLGSRDDIAPHLDLTLSLIANNLIRLWARWLKKFSASSTPYLLDELIRRPGEVNVAADKLTIHLEPRPLDIVLEMSGYLDPLEFIPWLPNKRIEFQR